MRRFTIHGPETVPPPPLPTPIPPGDPLTVCSCGAHLSLSQPDQRRPRRLLGVCTDRECGFWWRLWAPTGRKWRLIPPAEPSRLNENR
jgi:hypothetical protein